MTLVMKMNQDTIQRYLVHPNPDIQKRLTWIYQTLKKQLPDAEVTFAYQMPTFKQGKNLIHFAVYEKHIGIYPGPRGITYLNDHHQGLLTSKGAWRILHDQPLPKETFLDLVQWIQTLL
jgi:uncharacterized protein YdhG (YjbR/CyaY superfamily)